MYERPYVLSIAGFDPSGGAGITADSKTMEALKCVGLSVCTANTVQNDISFKACYWTELPLMLDQISLLFERFPIAFVKIGIVENWKVLDTLVSALLFHQPKVKIILDPVLSASASYLFHADASIDNRAFLDKILDKIYLITPNFNEIKGLYTDKNIEETIAHISNKTQLLLKGGHREDFLGKDVLYHCKGTAFEMYPSTGDYSEKHGSGCVLSSAITSYLALGFSIETACLKGKRYTEKVLSSTTNLLGYHG
ncbi:MAG: hydroxymethylpyrimidine/phosphomethylpyrimidine kinase [Flavobacteriaceae bacterium]|nr:MAG: hydroxymethylpyrimidine/phosphomethylpyrimidine kinase [Flavobacteriaceae bacterium]